MDDLNRLIRANWRKAMPLRAARPRGIRRRPKDDSEARALRELALRIATRAYQTWLTPEGPRRYRLISSTHR